MRPRDAQLTVLEGELDTTYHQGYDADDDNPEGVVQVVGDTGEGLPADDAVEDQEALHGEYREGAGDDRAIVSACQWLTVCTPATHTCLTARSAYVPPRVSRQDHGAHAELGSENSTVTSEHCLKSVLQLGRGGTHKYAGMAQQLQRYVRATPSRLK